MNTRGSVKEETDLVNFTRDLTTLKQLEAKETLTSLPFDNPYACHADGPVKTIQFDKELEIVSTEKEILNDNAQTEISQLRDRLKYLEGQNKRLKHLILFHLDLIQQNVCVTKTEKSNQSLKEENESVTLNSFKELVLPPKKPSHSLITGKNKKKNKQVPYPPSRSMDTGVQNLPKTDDNILDTSNINSNLKMIKNKRRAAKKKTMPEKHMEPLDTVTSTSGNPVIKKIQIQRKNREKIHRNKWRTSTCTTANKEVTDVKPLEDPYRIGEAEMRELSPILKLMLEKTNHKDPLAPSFNNYDLSKPKTQKVSKKSNKKNETKTQTIIVEDPDLDMIKTETEIYGRIPEEGAEASLCDFTFTDPVGDPYQIGEVDMMELSPEMKFCKVDNSLVLQKDTDLDMIGTETEIEEAVAANLCDFTINETSLDTISFKDLFGGDATLLNLEPLDYNPTSPHPENPTKRSAPTGDKEEGPVGKTKGRGKRGRKSGISKLKNAKAPPKPRAARGRAAKRGNKLSPGNNDSCRFSPVNVYKYKYPPTDVEQDCQFAVPKTHHR